MYNWFNYSRLKRQFENQLKENAELREENKNLEDILNSIGEDGTIEHNNAIKLRQENAKLNLRITELTKEVLGLRHLKSENVELLEKLRKEGNSYGMTFNEAKTQIIQNDYKKCTEERDEYKHQLNAANKEIIEISIKLGEQKDEIEKLKSNILDYILDLTVDEPQKHPMYPLHWGGYEQENILKDLPKSFPDEFKDEKTTAENLEERFDEGKDVMDYFNKPYTPPWKCTCKVCQESKRKK